MLNKISKIGVIVAAVLAILVARSWDRRENTSYNLAVLLSPLVFPPVEGFMDKSLEEQVSNLQGIIKRLEESQSSESQMRMNMGDKMADASFGANQTRVVELNVPSRSDPQYSIPVTCTCPSSASPDTTLPLVLFFHSGGMILGSIKFELHHARYIAKEAFAVVCSIGYRLAPKYPYPAATNDALDASLSILSLRTNVAEALEIGGIDTSRVATWGMSAGGYMSAHTTRLLTHEGIDGLVLQVSLVPMAKPHGGTPSSIKYWKDPFWSGPYNAYAWSVYLKGDDGSLAHDWKVSLLVDPPQETLKRLPPTYVQINSRDLLRDEGEMYAKRLETQGKLVELSEYDTTHAGGAPGFAGGGGAGSFEHAFDVLIQYLSK